MFSHIKKSEKNTVLDGKENAMKIVSGHYVNIGAFKSTLTPASCNERLSEERRIVKSFQERTCTSRIGQKL